MLIALMLQEDSNRSEPLNPIVYTFAEPMVGNAAFVQHWDAMMAYPNSQVCELLNHSVAQRSCVVHYF